MKNVIPLAALYVAGAVALGFSGVAAAQEAGYRIPGASYAGSATGRSGASSDRSYYGPSSYSKYRDHGTHMRVYTDLSSERQSSDSESVSGFGALVGVGIDLPTGVADYWKFDIFGGRAWYGTQTVGELQADYRQTAWGLSGEYQHQFGQQLGGIRAGFGLDYVRGLETLTVSAPGGRSGSADLRSDSAWAKLTLERDFALGGGWTVTPKANLRYLAYGRASVGGEHGRIKNGYGYGAGVEFSRKLRGGQLVSVEPYYQHTRIGAVDLGALGESEPSQGNAVGVRLTWSF